MIPADAVVTASLDAATEEKGKKKKQQQVPVRHDFGLQLVSLVYRDQCDRDSLCVSSTLTGDRDQLRQPS